MEKERKKEKGKENDRETRGDMIEIEINIYYKCGSWKATPTNIRIPVWDGNP